MRTLEISFEMSSISTSFLEMFSYATFVYFTKLAELFSIVFYWEAWLRISSLMALVLVCSYIILFSNTCILSSTLFFSTSILCDSPSVLLSEFFNITYCSFNLFFSFSISSRRYFKKSYSDLHFRSLSWSFSEVSYSLRVSFLTPVISLST